MISKEKYNKLRNVTLEMLSDCKIALSQEEKKHVEVADFGLDRIDEMGLQVITYVNTDRCCAKELVLTPWQICPEHRHPSVNGCSGKEETFRCRYGEVYLYVEGDKTVVIKARIPQDKEDVFTVFSEIVLRPGEQYTLRPNTLHWFQAGEQGCIVSEFSTTSRDELDIFTDPMIDRIPKVED
ncbi:D-lyxose isomerase [Vallitalea longa]|uniref:D-lyxose ketol-isomerase n=1 Tax=Vallitalea longa TaxID=2936439 RepID=A0A9W5Y7U1_9FIRM|nr:D-lyxose/D-mannose family sugar isomerase [Vallitalea longa]GKX28227.1 D-lyxose isomerase [Vallitalea longa]